MAALEVAVRSDPSDARSWFELGCALNRLNRPAKAVNALDCALTLMPDQVDAVCERATALTALGVLGEAGEAFEEILASDPLHGRARYALGSVRYRQGHLEEAAALWRGAAQLIDDPVDVLENVAIACQRLRLPDEEKAVWLEIIQRQPDHAVALHKLAAFGLRPMPERTSDACVQLTFDEFANEFDAVLGALDYAGPRIVDAMLRLVYGNPGGDLDVLDAGCGTGLCGKVLRPWARRLIGVDLSEGMLSRARDRGAYDALAQSELTVYLTAHPCSFDLIASSDVLIYWGVLDDVFQAIAGALRDGGRCCFTLEKLSGESVGSTYRLEPHGRFVHAGAYVEAALRRAGLAVLRMDTDIIRHEGGEPVEGWVVVAERRPISPML